MLAEDSKGNTNSHRDSSVTLLLADLHHRGLLRCACDSSLSHRAHPSFDCTSRIYSKKRLHPSTAASVRKDTTAVALFSHESFIYLHHSSHLRQYGNMRGAPHRISTNTKHNNMGKYVEQDLQRSMITLRVLGSALTRAGQYPINQAASDEYVGNAPSTGQRPTEIWAAPQQTRQRPTNKYGQRPNKPDGVRRIYLYMGSAPTN